MAAVITAAYIMSLCGNAVAEETTINASQISADLQRFEWKNSGLYGSYAPARFGFDSWNKELTPQQLKAAQEVLEALLEGHFEVIPRTEQSNTLDGLQGYLALKPGCKSQPIQYWDLAKSQVMNGLELSWYSKGKRTELIPYAPGTARPIDYEVQINGNLEVWATATRNFSLYDLGFSEHGVRRYVFGADTYLRKSGGGTWVEASFSAFETPTCEYLGGIDYLKRCPHEIALAGTIGDVAEVVRIGTRRYALTLSYLRCLPPRIPDNKAILNVWLLDTPGGSLPTIYAFFAAVPEG